jgi:hypothetical protein
VTASARCTVCSRVARLAAHRAAVMRWSLLANIIQRQRAGTPISARRRSNLQGTDPKEMIAAVRTRRAPMMSASAGLRLWPTSGAAERRALPLALASARLHAIR